MKSGKQFAGQEHLRIIRVRYCPEITEQVQRDKTSQARKSIHGLGPRSTGSMSRHRHG